MRALKIGEEIQGHRVLSVLGAGGYGAVYEALDLALERRVALKVLHPADADAAARFRDEARLLARVNDPHVVQIYQVKALDDGEVFLTMERFGDGALSSLLIKDQPQPPELAALITRQILEALDAAHRQGIVHRDIKEANVLIQREGWRVKVCDFGIARARDPLAGQAAQTIEGVLGTPHYIAPERFRGVRDDPRSDLYAVGVILYRLLTGRRPFEMSGSGNAMRIARKQLSEAVKPPQGAPRGLGALAAQLLERDPAARPATARQAIEALERACAQEETPAAQPAPSAHARRSPHPLLLPLMSVVMLLLIASLFWHLPKLKTQQIEAGDATPRVEVMRIEGASGEGISGEGASGEGASAEGDAAISAPATPSAPVTPSAPTKP
ncbi:serine/threonine protein kinase, partial [Myxococcota bacterium]|nr:serine/threonine protein kinase [Myxococcota bacterium]